METITLNLAKIKEISVSIVIPLVSLIIGVVPLVWNLLTDRTSNHFLRVGVALSLTMLTGVLFLSSVSSRVYAVISGLIFVLWLILLYRRQIRSLLYKMGLFRLFKIKVALIVPSNAIFNQEIVKGFTAALMRSFSVYNQFNACQRQSAAHEQITDIDYEYYINDAMRNNIKFMVLHIKSALLQEKYILDALIRFAKSGGTIINLISKLEVEPFIRSRVQLPFSIVLDHGSADEKLAQSLMSEIQRGTKILLLKGPESSETSTKRLEILSKYLLEAGAKVDFENLSRWTAELGYKSIDSLVNQKRWNYDWIIAWNDEIALGVCRFFDENPQVTKRPRVVGFDGLPEGVEKILDDNSVFYRTINMKMQKIGERAALLLDMIVSGADTAQYINIPVSSQEIISKSAKRLDN